MPGVTLLEAGRGLPQTGGEIYAEQIFRELVERGCQVRRLHVYTLRALTLVGFLPVLGTLLTNLALAPFLGWLPGLVIEDEHTTFNLIATNLLRRWRGARTVVVVHHMESRRLGRLRLGSADLIVTNSPATRQEVLDLGISPQRVVVVSPGFEPWEIGERRPPGPVLELLCVGGCSPRKGLLYLVQALALLPRGRFRVRVAGSTADPHFRKVLRPLVARLGLQDEFIFEGRVSTERLRGLYASSDIFVLPSLQEGFSIALSEALWAGLPVVASDLPALRSRVKCLVPPGDCEALARALAADPRRLRPQRVDETLTWERTRREFWAAVAPLT